MRVVVVLVMELGALAATYAIISIPLRLLRGRTIRFPVAIFFGVVLGTLLATIVALVASSYWPTRDWVYWLAVIPVLAVVVFSVLREPLKQVFSRPTRPT